MPDREHSPRELTPALAGDCAEADAQLLPPLPISGGDVPPVEVLEAMAVPFVALDPEFRYSFINARAARAHGIVPQVFLGRSLWEVFPVLKGTMAERRLREAMVRRVPVRFEHCFDPAGIWIEVSAHPLAAGGLGVFFRDISAQRAAVRASADQLRLIADTAPVMLAHLDREHRYRFVNLHYATRFGLRPEECVGRRLCEVVGEAAYAGIRPYVERALTGESMDFEVTLDYEGVGPRRMHCAYEPERDVSGAVVGLVAAISDITVRKRAEEALRRSEERLDVALRAAHLGIYDYDPVHNMVSWDARVRELWGAGPDETITYEVFVAGVHPEDRAQTEAAVAQALNPRGTGHYYAEYRVIHRVDGRTRWIVATGTATFVEGQAVRLVGTVQEITGQKEAEAALRRSEERYRAFIRNSSEGIWRLEFDPPIDTSLSVEEQVDLAYRDGRFAECNDAMARMYGLKTAADLSGRGLELMLPPTEPGMREFVASIIRAGYRVDDMDSEERDAAGRPVHFSNSMVGLVENGRLRRMWGTQRDITDRRRTEAALRESEARLALGMRVAGLALAEVDYATGDYHLTSEAARIFGLGDEAMTASREMVHGTFHPEDRPELMRRVDEALRPDGDGTFMMNHRVVWPGGEVRWLRVRKQVRFEGEGELRRPAHAILAMLDITDRKRAEAGLVEAKEMAEAANRSKDHFLAVLSHELRTPLTPVLMALGSMERDPTLSPEVREDIAMMQRNIGLETKLIDDLLDLNRIANGKLALEIETVDLNAIVHRVCAMALAQAEEHGLQLECVLGESVGFVAADPARLQQVLWNILRNAVKFTPDGGSIHVTTARLASGRCEVRVRDTGVGISPEMLPRIFDAFEQGGDGVNRQFGGLGLGLAICKALLDLHDGSVRAESTGEGQGATFIIELPVQPAPAPTATPASAVIGGQHAPRPRLLVVEDHADTAQALMRLLKRAGYTVTVAGDVASALAAAEQETFDVLVSDLGLPDGTGNDLMRRLRETCEMRGIAMSGFGMDEDLRRSREAGFAEHLVKPIDIPRLEEAIRRVMRRDR